MLNSRKTRKVKVKVRDLNIEFFYHCYRAFLLCLRIIIALINIFIYYVNKCSINKKGE
jgi:hypothetical protein